MGSFYRDNMSVSTHIIVTHFFDTFVRPGLPLPSTLVASRSGQRGDSLVQAGPNNPIQSFQPTFRLPDRSESCHTVTIELSNEGRQTRVSLSQDNNPTEQAREHSEKNWGMVLTALKKFLEE
jgi:hypothetical protein